MKIIIVGLGQTGTTLVKALADEHYDITVVDKDRALVDRITDRYNVNGVTGSGASRETLLAAGADTADAIVALTHIDEINLLSCMQAKALGTRRSGARLLLPDFVHESDSLKEQYDIDYFVKPKSDIAEEIFRNIGMPGFMKLEGYWGDSIQIIDLNILDDSPLAGRTLSDLKHSMKLDMLVVSVIRDDKLYIPDGNFTLKVGDNIGIAAAHENMGITLQALGITKRTVKRIVIVGGGITAGYLMEMLEKDFKNITILENDVHRCRELMEKYPSAKIAYSGGEILDVLEEEQVSEADCIISLTDNDETNLVISMYAWSCRIPSILTRVDKPEHVKLLHRVNIDITVSVTELSVLKMIRFVRNYEMGDADNEIGKFYNIAGNRAEIMEFNATGSFRGANIPFGSKEFRLKKDVLITSIIRNGQLIIPDGTAYIKEGDCVVIASAKHCRIRNLNEILDMH
ncbi:MAG: Trk system potassium transporter TrkA [Lachnospiraceae bacterium]|nr:Trk system potassium transporter TrkA [Lachnospiraceae bacterium]